MPTTDATRFPLLSVPGKNSETDDCAELKPVRAMTVRVAAIILSIIRINLRKVFQVNC